MLFISQPPLPFGIKLLPSLIQVSLSVLPTFTSCHLYPAMTLSISPNMYPVSVPIVITCYILTSEDLKLGPSNEREHAMFYRYEITVSM